MLPYCLKCKKKKKKKRKKRKKQNNNNNKKTESINPKLSKTSKGKTMLSLMWAVCESRKSKFMKSKKQKEY